MSKEVCKTIKHVEANISFDAQSQKYTLTRSTFDHYLPSTKGGEEDQCNSDDQKVICAFIGLVGFLNGNNDSENIESDKLAEYAILWLSYILNQKAQNGEIKLKDFFTNNIEKHLYYNEKITNDNDNMINKDLIDKKKDLMNMDIKDMSKFYEAFKILCKMYSAYSEKNKNCPSCSENAKEFVKKFETLNDDSNNTKGSSYSQILLTLSKDYNNLKNKCSNDPSSNFLSLPAIKMSQNNVESFLQTSGVTSSSSSIASKLIPVLLIFSAIPAFLGIAYKYSLFGFDKRLHRQYLREKIKKIKKKMNNYI
ncbi:CIR protein PIR protein [Plasmodium vinckei brucechwatti]|uniref:CIR protein PIR protein n=1 Tax=Plasmodium vinckei brucechwatti TaxID=119398 RepID=A0A6V7RTZ4_PLAVN|nr:CIR protein PIR protein [Plasmodium vinckei brucechwatti]